MIPTTMSRSALLGRFLVVTGSALLALILLALTGCSSTPTAPPPAAAPSAVAAPTPTNAAPPSPEQAIDRPVQECAAEHMRLLQEQSSSGTLLVPSVSERLREYGCGDSYQEALESAPATPPPASARDYSCSFPDGPTGPQVCEGNVPPSVGEYLTPEQYRQGG